MSESVSSRGGNARGNRMHTVRLADRRQETTMADNIADIARRHGFSPDAARAVAEALRRGGGRMAQFDHPELGGMGQWAAGGMLMIGDMLNNSRKARVEALGRDRAVAPGSLPAAAEPPPGQ